MAGLIPDLGDIVAIYGAALATALGLGQWRRERNPLYISLHPAYLDQFKDDQGEWQTGPAYFRVRVVNRSAGPITIESFGIGLKLDWRRIPAQLLGTWRSEDYAVKSGKFRLEAFEPIEDDVLEDDVMVNLYGPPPELVKVHFESGDAEGWEGLAPLRIDHVWARDVARRRYVGSIDPLFRRQGYEPWDLNVPPILRGRVRALWLRKCIDVYNTRRFGLPDTFGPKIVNFLHRTRLFPIALPRSNSN
jgi:hypothetical protein